MSLLQARPQGCLQRRILEVDACSFDLHGCGRSLSWNRCSGARSWLSCHAKDEGEGSVMHGVASLLTREMLRGRRGEGALLADVDAAVVLLAGVDARSGRCMDIHPRDEVLLGDGLHGTQQEE